MSEIRLGWIMLGLIGLQNMSIIKEKQNFPNKFVREVKMKIKNYDKRFLNDNFEQI